MDNSFLSEAEIAQIIAFTSNKPMFSAVRKALEHTIHRQGVMKPGEEPETTNWVFSLVSALDNNEKLGEMVRASAAGLGYLKAGLDKLSALKMPEKKEKPKNPAV